MILDDQIPDDQIPDDSMYHAVVEPDPKAEINRLREKMAVALKEEPSDRVRWMHGDESDARARSPGDALGRARTQQKDEAKAAMRQLTEGHDPARSMEILYKSGRSHEEARLAALQEARALARENRARREEIPRRGMNGHSARPPAALPGGAAARR